LHLSFIVNGNSRLAVSPPAVLFLFAPAHFPFTNFIVSHNSTVSAVLKSTTPLLVFYEDFPLFPKSHPATLPFFSFSALFPSAPPLTFFQVLLSPLTLVLCLGGQGFSKNCPLPFRILPPRLPCFPPVNTSFSVPT